jgi:hypothetical protein
MKEPNAKVGDKVRCDHNGCKKPGEYHVDLNFGKGIPVFETTDAYCLFHAIELEWKINEKLQALKQHVVTGNIQVIRNPRRKR